jgi:ABC-2 type transport system permease protein
VYSPTILPQEKHPIVKNLDRIKFDFVSTIDTISTSAPIRKEVLIRTSDKSTIMRTPNEVVLMYAMMDRDPRTFNKPHQNVAVLLEGTFHSYFRQKILPPEIENSPEIGYLKNGRSDSRIIVIADGDVAINPVYQGQALPLGLDRLNRMNRNFYANKKLLINCANYLLDDNGLLSVRSREVTLRLLDRGKIKEQRLKWQLINTILPIASIMLFGLFRMWARRKKYGSGMLNSSRKGPFEIMEYVMALISGVILYLMFSNWILAGAAVAIVLGLFFIRSKRQSE